MSFVRDARAARVLLAIACAVVVGLLSALPASAQEADDERGEKDRKRHYTVEEGPCDLDKMPKGAVHQWTPGGESIVHRVAYGQGLQDIAQRYGIEGAEAYRVLWDANPQLDALLLERSGITIRIPACGTEIRKRKLPKPPPPPEPEPEAESAGDDAAEDGGGDDGGGRSDPEPQEATAVAGGGVWDRLAECESGGNWSINTGNGYYGGLQFSLQSWRGVGGSGYPHEHSREEQIKRAEMLKANGGWGHWPSCAAKLGLL